MNLVCPLCRTHAEDQLREWRLRRRPDMLRCSNPGCEGRFITSPFPILMANPGGVLDRMVDLPPNVSLSALGMLLQHLSHDTTLFEVLSARSTALWSQFHDYLPEGYRPDGVHPAPFAIRALALLDAVRLKPGCRALVAGCGPGREALELAARLRKVDGVGGGNGDDETTTGMFFPEVVALDRDPVMLSAYRALVEERSLQVLLRAGVDRWHTPETIELPRPLRAAIDIVQPICADILDPPFPTESFDLIVALNLIDDVAEPMTLLHWLNAMLKPGGHLLLSSPYAWRDAVTPRSNRPATLVPHARMADAVLVQEILTGQIPTPWGFKLQPVAIMEPLPWPMRVHDTLSVVYRSHISLWRKP